jgi:hypothetical protein
MRPFRLALLALLVAIASLAPAADEPAPLLKPVAPPGGGARLRIPIAGASQFKARIPRGGKAAKKGETIEITVTVDTTFRGGRTTLKTWQSWGYEADKAGQVVLPELFVSAAQIAPKAAKGHDVEIRVPAVNVRLTETTGDKVPTDGGHLVIDLGELTRAPDRSVEPRLHLADKFLELSLPNSRFKRTATESVPAGEVQTTADETLVPVAAPTVNPDRQIFAFSSVNGLTQYKMPDGKIEPVLATFSNVTGRPIILTFRLAQGCGVEMEEPAGNWSYLKGKVKELRIGLRTGPGLKAAKDFVLKDAEVLVSNEQSHGIVVLGPEFAAAHSKDGVYGCGPDGIWRLHGRVKPELLQDVKTRTPPKKP